MPKKTRRKYKAPKKKFEAVPKEFHSVTPYLSIKGAAQAIEWYKTAFGAKEIKGIREQTPDGKVIHARIKIGNSIIMLSDVFPGGPHKDPLELGATPVTLHIYSKNVDTLWKRAVDAGAKTEMPLGDMFWGERYGQLTDPFGHAWSLSMRIQMSPEEMERMRKEAMKMFQQSNTAGHEAPP